MRSILRKTLFSLAACVALPVHAADGERVSLHELLDGWGVDLDTVEIRTENLADGLHVLRGAGGAVIASVGPDGVLIVDDQFDATVDKLRSAIDALGGDGIDLVVNTHAHFDHADGNPALGAAGARIVAHENARRLMMTGATLDYVGRVYEQPAYPASGLPDMTFDDAMRLYFNGEQIDLVYGGAGHTDGDIAVWFRNANVVHVGDLYTDPWPYIDAANGGSLGDFVRTLDALHELIDDETRIVSGHRPTVSRSELRTYTDRLQVVHERLARMRSRGMTIEEVIAAAPTADLVEDGTVPVMFLTLAYRTIGGDSPAAP